MSKLQELQIPFDKRGDLLSYDFRGSVGEWVDNYEFDDTLTYGGFSRGRSSLKFHFKRSDGRSVEFFAKDMGELFSGVMIKGRFTF